MDCLDNHFKNLGTKCDCSLVGLKRRPVTAETVGSNPISRVNVVVVFNGLAHYVANVRVWVQFPITACSTTCVGSSPGEQRPPNPPSRWVRFPPDMYAKIAQVVERAPEERSVGGSTPSLGTLNVMPTSAMDSQIRFERILV